MEHSKVLDARKREDGTVWRKRVCGRCHTSFNTYEITDDELERLRRLDNFERKLVAFADELQSAAMSEPGAVATGFPDAVQLAQART